ncbi:outer membrane beta-barrel domain-containing protein [Bdellovibrio sp. 22V]|uniref:outer membrane beta-barrel domain-containing protein n=1 Tax=Bdellovibrio TaxID=958 RepID=UPI0025438A47|nr:outer membrane beta-barrel domain-containing protein [Bdellovibrio sp. 22V]WII73612.1 outer membrane beta-barrel domain-containing protein [Bdellovibrio sp. 22V]
MKSLGLIFALFASSVAFAQVEQELDSFGGNQALYEKAKALNPEVENEVVQNRFMTRTNRFEIAPEMAGVFGGDSYNNTNNVGVNVHYHINPTWSVGVKYSYSFNELTPEGKSMVEKANQAAAANPKDPSYLFPQVVYPKSELLGLVNWYPIVGKLSFGKWGVAHFDTYLTAGYGQMELSNGSSPAATAGLGLGFWVNRNLTTRLEYRVQQYTAEYYQKTENLMTSVASVQVGWML